MEFLYERLIIFLLIFLRISGIFIISPFFSSSVINTKTRLALTFIISYLMYSVIPKSLASVSNISLYNFFYFSIKELLVGFIIGFLVFMLFSAVQTAAQIYSMDMGFGMLNIFDPLSQYQIPVLGQVNYIFLTLIFLNMGTHRSILAALAESFYKYRVAEISYNVEGITKYISGTFVYYFTISLKIALPLVGVLLLANVILGIMARIAPQMNVFFIGMPLKIMVGFFILIALMPYLFGFMKILLDDGIQRLYKAISIMFS